MSRLMTRRALRLAALAMLALGALPLPGRAAEMAVTIADFVFAPATLTVAPGTRVIWTNKDEEPHTVTSADAGATLKSPALDTDDTFAFTFTNPGTYRYFCSIHPHMTGTIVVK